MSAHVKELQNAFMSGAAWGVRRAENGQHPYFSARLKAAQERFPNPTVTQPRVLTAFNGSPIRYVDGEIQHYSGTEWIRSQVNSFNIIEYIQAAVAFPPAIPYVHQIIDLIQTPTETVEVEG